MATPKKEKRPVMALLELLGKRWVLRIFWEMRDGQAYSFRDLQARCGNLSPTVLNGRMKDLRAAGYVELVEGGYSLTERGRQLLPILQDLNDFASASP